ncbi:phage tail fiber protein, partial [Raoultella ornithinolytica]|nr:phage tail protein [Raoultella ornithinolytica]
MSVPNQTPYNIHTANGLTTVFTYEFYIINASDLQISINGTVAASGYTVAGVGNKGGGDITFMTPPANGAVVMLERVVPTYRLTDYQDNGDLLADTVNMDFDRIWMAIQRAFIDLGFALTRPFFGGPFNARGYRIGNIANPVNDQDAATKKYVDRQIFDNTNAWKQGDLALDQKIDANFRRTIRVPEGDVEMVPSVTARANSLFGWN